MGWIASDAVPAANLKEEEEKKIQENIKATGMTGTNGHLTLENYPMPHQPSEGKEMDVPMFQATWQERPYLLTQLEATQVIPGIEEMCTFIMNGGCSIGWSGSGWNPKEDATGAAGARTREYCMTSRSNWKYICRYVMWASSGDADIMEMLKAKYLEWCTTKTCTSLHLEHGSPDSFDWYCNGKSVVDEKEKNGIAISSDDRWGSCSWVTEVIPAFKTVSAISHG